MKNADKKYVLGSYARGSRVQLDAGGRTPGRWVTVVGNYARTSGVVTCRVEETGAIVEKDGHDPLFDIDPSHTFRLS